MVAMKLRQLNCASGEEERPTTLRRLGSPERVAPSARAPTPLVVLMISASDFSMVNILVVVEGNLGVQLVGAGGLLVLLGDGNVVAGGGGAEESVICWLSLQVQAFDSVVEELEPELARAAWN